MTEAKSVDLVQELDQWRQTAIQNGELATTYRAELSELRQMIAKLNEEREEKAGMTAEALERLMRMARPASFRMAYTGNVERAKADAARFASQLAEDGVISSEDVSEVERVLLSYSVPVAYVEAEYGSAVDALSGRPGGIVPGQMFS